MVTHESWFRMIVHVCGAWVSAHRILLYIAFVTTVTLLVQLLGIDLVGE